MTKCFKKGEMAFIVHVMTPGSLWSSTSKRIFCFKENDFIFFSAKKIKLGKDIKPNELAPAYLRDYPYFKTEEELIEYMRNTYDIMTYEEREKRDKELRNKLGL